MYRVRLIPASVFKPLRRINPLHCRTRTTINHQALPRPSQSHPPAPPSMPQRAMHQPCGWHLKIPLWPVCHPMTNQKKPRKNHRQCLHPQPPPATQPLNLCPRQRLLQRRPRPSMPVCCLSPLRPIPPLALLYLSHLRSIRLKRTRSIAPLCLPCLLRPRKTAWLTNRQPPTQRLRLHPAPPTTHPLGSTARISTGLLPPALFMK